jgi:hypothetical protein
MVLPEPGGTDENHIVTAGGGDFESAFHVLLAFHIVEVGAVLRVLIEQVVEIGRGDRQRLGAVQKLHHLR